MKISVAAVPYFWGKSDYYQFYQQISESPVDIVYLGESVCSKRRSMKLADWFEIAKMLQTAGKQSVMSSMTLLEANSELKYLKQICTQSDFIIEANDVAAIQMCHTNQREFICGSSINIYNCRSFDLMIKNGMRRWVIPVELGIDAVTPIIKMAKSRHIEVEYQGFGRMALAHSARCFTARHLGLSKDKCEFKCGDYEQGFIANSQEGQPFIQVNGIQSQSAKLTNLLPYWQQMYQAGIDIFRIMPTTPRDTLEVVNHLAKSFAIKQPLHPETIPLQHDYQFCNGYWFQIEGMNSIS